MSAMSRLATDMVLATTGRLSDDDRRELAIMLAEMDDSPDDYPMGMVLERDVIDPLRDAPWVQCEDCGHYDHPVFMHRFDEDSVICPSCYWTEETAARQFAIDAGMWDR